MNCHSVVLSVIFAFFMAITSSFAADNLPATVDRPDVKVGDTWTYNVTDKSGQTTSFAQVVSKIDDENIAITSTNVDQQRSTPLVFTNEWNLVERFDRAFSPFLPLFSFPLYVGKTWKADYSVNWKGRLRKAVDTVTVTVVGMEKVTTPAGAFSAFKIVSEGTYRTTELMNTWTGRMKTIFWYAPEAKRIVELNYEDEYDKEVDELVSYKLN